MHEYKLYNPWIKFIVEKTHYFQINRRDYNSNLGAYDTYYIFKINQNYQGNITARIRKVINSIPISQGFFTFLFFISPMHLERYNVYS